MMMKSSIPISFPSNYIGNSIKRNTEFVAPILDALDINKQQFLYCEE